MRICTPQHEKSAEVRGRLQALRAPPRLRPVRRVRHPGRVQPRLQARQQGPQQRPRLAEAAEAAQPAQPVGGAHWLVIRKVVCAVLFTFNTIAIAGRAILRDASPPVYVYGSPY